MDFVGENLTHIFNLVLEIIGSTPVFQRKGESSLALRWPAQALAVTYQCFFSILTSQLGKV